MKRERGGYITEVGKESIMGSWISTFVSRLESFFSWLWMLWVVLRCALRAAGVRNVSSHSVQCWGLSCCFLCTLRAAALENTFPHRPQFLAVVPVWILTWAVSVDFTVNALEQWGHLYGFSLVWIRMCLNRSLGFLHSLGQKLQRNSLFFFTFLTRIRCFLSFPSTVLSANTMWPLSHLSIPGWWSTLERD